MLLHVRQSTLLYLSICSALALTGCQSAADIPQPQNSSSVVQWPQESVETKPGTRWWWMGSAVDEENLAKNLKAYAEAGLGTVEITPIYGVQGNDANDVKYLSDRWMQLYKYTVQQAHKLGMNVDMNTGTGWPFGGPRIDARHAAGKLLVKEFHLKTGETLNETVLPDEKEQIKTAKLATLMAYSSTGEKIDLTDKVVNDRLEWTATPGQWHLIALFEGNTFQKVKRAAPGGEGLVLNHFSKKSVDFYLQKFTDAFAKSNAPAPHNFFNDSYEVYDADWSRGLLDEFEKMQGYKLQDYLPLFLSKERTDLTARIISDYRETLSSLLLQNFTKNWTRWAHSLNSKTRSQAHGSPGNLIDLYAAVDIPECEGFGLSDFHIKGLRTDYAMTRHNYSDFSMLKYASSAAHISGKKYTSSETLTWLTEHFRMSFSQAKPDLDLMFLSGVNHVYFHGTPYSPVDAAWPGWLFYASVNMSPTNPLWRDAKPFFKYISRVQSFMQKGEPDNDFLVYLPVYDMWQEQPGRLLMFDIHQMKERAPRFIAVVDKINEAGYDMDYISDNFIRSTSVDNGKLTTAQGVKYKAMIVPPIQMMPLDVLEKVINLAKQGAKIVFMDNYPSDVPGFGHISQRQAAQKALIKELPAADFKTAVAYPFDKGEIITGSDYSQTLAKTGISPEGIKTQGDLRYIRRKDKDGYIYFVSALKADDTDQWVPMATTAKSAVLFNPLDGTYGKAGLKTENGQMKVHLQLKSGESVIIHTYTDKDVNTPDWPYITAVGTPFSIADNWKLHFIDSVPAIKGTFNLPKLMPWTQLSIPAAKDNMGTGVYTTTFKIDKGQSKEWILDLGDVRETARVKINGQDVQTLWCVPYQVRVGQYLKDGTNSIEIQVTGLPANHIASLDRQGVKWRKFKQINMVDLNYKTTTYKDWKTVPQGLNSQVRLIPVSTH